MQILIESMTKFVHKIAPWQHYTVRCWRQETDYSPEASKQSQVDCIAAIEKMPKEKQSVQVELAKTILAVERMNAVEVLDEMGAGVILYSDWP